MATFKHSGDIGDIIYSLPAAKYLGGGIYYLSLKKNNLYPGFPTKFDQKGYDLLRPLLLAQPYIEDVRLWDGEEVDYDFDKFRNYNNIATENLARLHCRILGVPEDEIYKPWLTATTKSLPEGKSVVFARSSRYHGYLSWYEVIRSVGDKAVFVGLPDEYEAFVREYLCSDIPYLPVENFLELAEYINGCELFVGNQSSPFAVSQGLGVDNLLEVSACSPNCNFERK